MEKINPPAKSNYRRIPILFFFVFYFIGYQVFSRSSSGAFDSIALKVKEKSFCNGRQARVLLKELYQITQNDSVNKSLPARYLYAETYLNYSQGTNDSSLISRIRSCSESLPKEAFFEKALLNYSQALGNMPQGNYAEAFKMALSALEQFKQIGQNEYAAETLNLLGNICNYIKSHATATDYYKQAKSYTNASQRQYYKITLDMYTGFSREEPQKDWAIDSLLYFISIKDQYKDTGLFAIACLNVGACYSIKGDHQQAFRYYSTLLDLIPFIDNHKLTIVLYQNLGMYYTNSLDFKKAFRYFTAAKTVAEKDQNLMRLLYVFSGLSHMYEKLGQVDSAFFYLKKYNDLNNKLIYNSNAIEAYQAYVSELLESSKKELKIAEQSLLLKNRRFAFTIMIGLAVIALSVLTFIIFQQKKRQQALIREAENRDLNEKLKHEQKIKQLQQLQHQQALELKAREVASYSLLLSEKNNVLQQISELTAGQSKNQEDSKNNHPQINQIIKANLQSDQGWENFMLHFDKVHPSFFDKLKAHCGDLTDNNLRLCAYFRIGLSLKEVAKLLNVSTETSKTSRYRLKKKLGLKEDENLDDFLKNI